MNMSRFSIGLSMREAEDLTTLAQDLGQEPEELIKRCVELSRRRLQAEAYRLPQAQELIDRFNERCD